MSLLLLLRNWRRRDRGGVGAAVVGYSYGRKAANAAICGIVVRPIVGAAITGVGGVRTPGAAVAGYCGTAPRPMPAIVGTTGTSAVGSAITGVGGTRTPAPAVTGVGGIRP